MPDSQIDLLAQLRLLRDQMADDDERIIVIEDLIRDKTSKGDPGAAEVGSVLTPAQLPIACDSPAPLPPSGSLALSVRSRTVEHDPMPISRRPHTMHRFP